MTNLGKILAAYEQKHDLTAQLIADEIGLNKNAYSRIKSGKAFDAADLLTLMAWALAADPTTVHGDDGFDALGMAHDAAIHSTPATKNADGSWRMRRGKKVEYEASMALAASQVLGVES